MSGRHLITVGTITREVRASLRLSDFGPIYLVTTPDRGVVYETAVAYEDTLGLCLAGLTYQAATAACRRGGRN